MAAKYTVEQIETVGIKCLFDSMGAQRDGWIMPDGYGVDYAGYAQLSFEPETVATLNQEGLMRARVAVATKMLNEHYSIQPCAEGEVRIEKEDTLLLAFSMAQAGRSTTQVLKIKFSAGAASWRSASLFNLTEALDSDPSWSPSFSAWRHGGWYVTNVRYPTGAIGCVSNNYADGKWRIVCDSRRNGLNEPGDFTFASRDVAAKAERELVRIEALDIQAKLASTEPNQRTTFATAAASAAA
ncbi:hypothetical protein [Pseudomonas putida]|uniref:hypothetical protein n=1 Tax=Pseudomonas putida TaxID=303 RepID=UPI00192E4463|nr:hypothetical protein [Pseudomonas putida]